MRPCKVCQVTQQSSHMHTNCYFSLKPIEVHCACIHYHSHTYIRHRDRASKTYFLMPKYTLRVYTLVLSFKDTEMRAGITSQMVIFSCFIGVVLV